MIEHKSIPSVTVNYACTGSSKKSNELGMRVMQERAFEKRGEQYLNQIAAGIGKEPCFDVHRVG